MAGWKHHASKEETQKILDMFIESNQVFAIYHKEDQKVIGSLEIKKIWKRRSFDRVCGLSRKRTWFCFK